MRPVPRLLLLMTVALLALAVAPAAEAHDQPELRVAVRRTAAELVVTIEADDAARALAPDRRALVAHADGLVRATDADGATLVFASRGETDARFVLRAMAPVGDVVLALSLFGRDGGEAVVRIGDGEHERIVRVELPGVVRVEAGPIVASGVDFGSFVRSGVEHIVTGYDHLAFLLVLVVVARSLADVVKVATAFTLAHSVTLGLAAFDVVRVPSAPVEVAIAASIVLAAIGNVVAPTAKHRALVAFGFGLVHGLGFSSGLAELLEGSTAGKLGAVVGFNLGVEAGQVALLVVVAPLLLLWRRRSGASHAWLGVRVASLAVAALGAYWVVERLGG